jgi:hypothetical protein
MAKFSSLVAQMMKKGSMICTHMILEETSGKRFKLIVLRTICPSLDQAHEVWLTWMGSTSLVATNENKDVTSTISSTTILKRTLGKLSAAMNRV